MFLCTVGSTLDFINLFAICENDTSVPLKMKKRRQWGEKRRWDIPVLCLQQPTQASVYVGQVLRPLQSSLQEHATLSKNYQQQWSNAALQRVCERSVILATWIAKHWLVFKNIFISSIVCWLCFCGLCVCADFVDCGCFPEIVFFTIWNGICSVVVSYFTD